jgi:hypothetical protein
MPKAKQKKQIALPGWLNNKIDEQSRVKVKKATIGYICDNNLQKKLPTPNTDTFIKILPYMTKLDSDWGVVTPKIFNTGKFQALETYCQAIRNYLASKGLKQAIKDAENAEQEDTE